MAVTKQTYSAAPTWTAAQLAQLFEDAFIDAGLMTAWYDSFLSGSVENRVLEVTYDASKTYGKCYYWFQFTTSFAGVSIASGWDAATDVPTGTQYLDFFATTTNTTANHYSIAGTLIASTQISLVRYTSGGHSWFVLRNGSTPFPFMITPGSATIVPWLDLDKTLFHHFVTATPRVGNPTSASSSASIRYDSVYRLRRSYVAGYSLVSNTTISNYRDNTIPLHSYHSLANNGSNQSLVVTDGGSFGTNTTSLWIRGLSTIFTPAGLNNTNPAYATDYVPVLFGISYSPYVSTPLPADFAIYFPFTATQFSFGDNVVISAGTEEWEVLAFANNNQTTSPNPLLLARIV
jgi:hypothetical protein